MIGNTDWSVPGEHNVKLIQAKSDTNSLPFAVPYDFDYSGIINTDYAIPDPMFETVSVKERVYRGYSRSMEELNVALEVFNQKKEALYALINDFELLTPASKKNMTKYLDSFYDLIKNPRDVKIAFIDNARED